MFACILDGCEKRSRNPKSAGLCHMHYHRQRRKGSTGTASALVDRTTSGLAGYAKTCSCGTAFRTPFRDQIYCGRDCYHAQVREHVVARTEKVCGGCRQVKPLTHFAHHADRADGRQSQCKTCGLAAKRNAQSTNRLKRFNITLEQYDAMLEAQGHACAICRTLQADSDRPFHVDHDHACCPESGRSCGQCVRGLLCFRCNSGLGMFRDNTESLAAAVGYLARRVA